MVKENGLIFREEQKFSKLVRWLLVLDSAFFIVLILFLFFYLGKKSTQPLPPVAIIAIPIIPIVVMILFWIAKLETEVRSEGLYIRFFPLHVKFKRFAFDDFCEYYAREYSPILEYGGWGIRYGFGGSGRAYNMSGKKGLQIVFKNGKKLLVGSQKPQELVTAVDSIIKGNEKK